MPEIELELSRMKPPQCKHCGREKGNHLAGSLHCPIGRGGFPSFSRDKMYEPRKTRVLKKAAE